MGLIDLKSRLRDVAGIEALTMQVLGGRSVFALNGKIISVAGDATEEAAERAIRAAIGSDAIAQIPAGVPVQPSAPSVALIPKVVVAVPQTKESTMSVTGAGHAGFSLKSLVAQHKKMLADAQAKVENNFAKLAQAAQGMDKLGDTVGAEADDLIAAIGQFTNDPTGESHG